MSTQSGCGVFEGVSFRKVSRVLAKYAEPTVVAPYTLFLVRPGTRIGPIF